MPGDQEVVGSNTAGAGIFFLCLIPDEVTNDFP